jgi:hypothetical protein
MFKSNNYYCLITATKYITIKIFDSTNYLQHQLKEHKKT